METILVVLFREFDKCFSGGENMSGTSLLVWLDGEVQWFTEILDKQVSYYIKKKVRAFPETD